MKALALTDHGNLYGAIEFYNAAKAKAIKPLIGCELYIVESSRLEKHGRSDDEGNPFFTSVSSPKTSPGTKTCSNSFPTRISGASITSPERTSRPYRSTRTD